MLAICEWVCIDSFMDTTDTSLSAPHSAAGNAVETIGRYSRAYLEAMHGKRGRKPPEYFTLFPERVRTAPTPRRIKVAEAPELAEGGYDVDPLAARLRLASPAVRRLVSDLLEVVATSSHHLQGQANHQAEISPMPAPADAEQIPQKILQQVVLNEPVYADPELEPELAEQT